MNTLNIVIPKNGIVELTKEESKSVNGGNPFVLPFLAVGAIAGAALAIYNLGKATGEFIYKVTH